MRALLCTNHLNMWSGSELVVLEIADELKRRGSDVHLVANVVVPPLRAAILDNGFSLSDDPARLRAFDYDLIWNQHHTACLLDFSVDSDSLAATRIVYAHLSPYEPLEQPGFVVESAIADLVVCNSPETERMVVDEDVNYIPRRIMPNPAPTLFARIRHDRDATRPRQIAVISNHPPREVLDALEILGSAHAIRTTRIGHRGDRYERISPELLAEADVVISIGKTIPYCLMAAIPVYCYDRFGGPGYLTPDNFVSAEAMNFSGRCCGRRLDGASIAAEIIDGYSAAARAATEMEVPARFFLEPHLDAILSTPVSSNSDKRARLDRQSHRLRREIAIAKVIRAKFRAPVAPNTPAK